MSELPRLSNFTPLRYPGGKGKLAPFIKQIVESNGLEGGAYAEPYAGGAGIALELLLQEYVDTIYLNDINRQVWSFWRSILDEPEALCRLISDSPLTLSTWDAQKEILKTPEAHSTLELGFAMFYLNRTNRSGILNGGVIGGRSQNGRWKIDARFNRRELVRRVQCIANVGSRITLSCLDASIFLEVGSTVWPENTLIYLDPPYYVRGRSLYFDSYSDSDHRALAILMNRAFRQKWIVSYDDVEEIREMYTPWRALRYQLGYSARETRVGNEIMFFCDELNIPDAVSPMKSATLFPGTGRFSKFSSGISAAL